MLDIIYGIFDLVVCVSMGIYLVILIVGAIKKKSVNYKVQIMFNSIFCICFIFLSICSFVLHDSQFKVNVLCTTMWAFNVYFRFQDLKDYKEMEKQKIQKSNK